MILRPHQERTIAATQAAFRRVRRVLITAPTGFGKTAVAAVLIARAVARGRRVLFLVHLREVVLDTARRLRAAGVPCGVLMAGETRTTDCVQVASIQTVCAREDHPPADLVVWDECHHAAAQSYREVAAQYPGAWHLGLTATPERADGQGLRDAFDEIVVGATVRELVDGGFLAPLDIVAPSSRLQGAIACEPAEAVRRYARGRPAVVFCRTVEASRALAAELGPRALHVDGATATPERDAALTAFAQGDADVLCNVFVLTEGWDCERAEVCVMARGCGSASMLLQAVGRVRRLTPGSAKRALLVDLGGVVHEHGHPDEDRSYTLDGITRRPRADRPWLCQCRVCGAVVEGSRRGPRCACGADWPPPPRMRVRRAELTDRVEIVSRIERDRVFAQLQRTAEQRGYKPAWAAVRFKDRFGFWPRARGGAA